MDDIPMVATRLLVGELHNTYWAGRHGPSQANKAGIIVSDPKYGIRGYGLTKDGRKDVLASALLCKRRRDLDHSTVIVSSDFRRAKESARIIAKELNVLRIIIATELRERFFGRWEKTSNANYERVWADDATDSHHKNDGVESVEEVLKRALLLIGQLEQKYVGRKILLVSHGDTLQILQTFFKDVHPSGHRSLPHLRTGEIRALN